LSYLQNVPGAAPTHAAAGTVTGVVLNFQPEETQEQKPAPWNALAHESVALDGNAYNSVTEVKI
jgi:hypothetical protein